MTRAVQVTVLALLVAAAPAAAEVAPGDLEEVRQKSTLTETDRSRIRAFVQRTVRAMLTNTDPDQQGMVRARRALLEEVRNSEISTEAYRRAFAEIALDVLQKADDKAVSQPARVNFVMTLAGLQVIESAPLLESVLAEDPYPASRYRAAKGLARLAPKIVQSGGPRMEGEVAESIDKALQQRQPIPVLMQLFEAVGAFDHPRAHDTLASGVVKVAGRLDASDPVARKMVLDVIPSLERAYAREVRPEAKKDLLLAYAALCTHVMPPLDVSPPPAGYSRLMTNLNASLEKITGEDVGFDSTDPLPLQQLSLLEWVERLVRTRQIPRRPEMPPAVEEAVRKRQSESGAEEGAPGEDAAAPEGDTEPAEAAGGEGEPEPGPFTEEAGP